MRVAPLSSDEETDSGGEGGGSVAGRSEGGLSISEVSASGADVFELLQVGGCMNCCRCTGASGQGGGGMSCCRRAGVGCGLRERVCELLQVLEHAF